ncbi:MAG: glycerate kinase [Candidatus Hodarchaeota archaeon]
MIRNIPELIKGSAPTQHARRIVLHLLNEALNAVNPRTLTEHALRFDNSMITFGNQQLHLDEINGVFVIGAGKATGRMAEAIETLLNDHIIGGLIIVPETTVNDYSLDLIQIRGGGHPVPTEASITATQQLIDMVTHTPPDTLILSLFSGGGSALLTLPSPPITLEELQQTTELLLRSGMPIAEINTIRKHLSQVKGGQLFRHIHPRHHWGLLLSDVPDDQLDMIASGPTLPDSTTFSDVATLFDTYQLWNQVPGSVQDHLTTGVQGRAADTPKPNDPLFIQSFHQLIGTNHDACQAALAHAQHQGFKTRILTTNCQGEAREVGAQLGRLAQQLTLQEQAQIVIIGSETTVTIQQEGKGGRNTELVAAALPYMHGTKGLVLASLATDGLDGPTDAAGAIADGESHQRAHVLNLSPTLHLESNTTYHLFHNLGDLLITGPTHTNVRDITLILWMGTGQ